MVGSIGSRLDPLAFHVAFTIGNLPLISTRPTRIRHLVLLASMWHETKCWVSTPSACMQQIIGFHHSNLVGPFLYLLFFFSRSLFFCIVNWTPDGIEHFAYTCTSVQRIPVEWRNTNNTTNSSAHSTGTATLSQLQFTVRHRLINTQGTKKGRSCSCNLLRNLNFD